MDGRNQNVTNKVFEVLRNTEGFEAAVENPENGAIIARYGGTSFYLNIEPIYDDNEDGWRLNNRPFEEIVKNHSWVFH